jgi:uncharacterized protein (DUF1501 family)
MNDRRRFLKQTLAGSAAISLSGAMPNFLLGASRESEKVADEKILVVLQLSGGNDGLNTVIPYGDDEYYKNRFTLAIGKGSVLKIDDHVGFHPSLKGFHELLQNGQLAVVQGVGYPNPNRSHFESMDLWHTAHRAQEPQRHGWLGRLIDENWPGNDLPALHIGDGLQPLALRNDSRPVPSIQSIDNFRLNVFQDSTVRSRLAPLIGQPRRSDNELLSYVHESANVALETSHRIEAIAGKTKNNHGYPGSTLGRNLGVIAQLIGSGLSTRIYYTTLDGFDTHSSQAETHQALLNDLSQSVRAFAKELTANGNEQRVALIAFSEFGRRVRENASRGTDHGTAAPLFVAGARVKSALVGEHPSLAPDRLVDGDLQFQIDYRSVYAELLENWLGVPSQAIVGAGHEPIRLFKA